MYLQKKNGYSDYETASAAATLDVGNVFGGILIGYLTDLTYSRRTPLAAMSIVLSTGLMILMVSIPPGSKVLFFIFIFFLGILLGGA